MAKSKGQSAGARTSSEAIERARDAIARDATIPLTGMSDRQRKEWEKQWED